MAQPNVFFKGEEKKFAINIAAAGFSMDTDDFEIEVTSGRDNVSVLKKDEPNERGIWANEDGTLVTFYETDAETSAKNWYCILDTKDFTTTGQLTVTATAYVTDAKAYDGVRKCIDQAVLGTLKNK